MVAPPSKISEGTMMLTIALFGAGGNMGTRILSRLRDDADYRMLYVEADEARRQALREQGLQPTTAEQAAREADVAILAVPDRLIGTVAEDIVSALKSGAMVMCLDAAAPYAGKLPPREDISYFVTHPTHPPLFAEQPDAEARRDFFGGVAKQSIVCALMQGPEDDYGKGEQIARKMFGPILRSHRVTVEQLALLEPALAETVAATCITVVREAMDEALRRGVPEQAARDFLLGHLNIELAILFGECQWQFSAGAQRAVEDAKRDLFRPDWRKVFDPAQLRKSVLSITEG
jgi:Arc/MetJ family transcription regulator